MQVLRVAELLVLGVTYALCGDIVLKPIKAGHDEIGLIFIQGAQISPDRYLPLMSAIQQASQYSIWVGIPDFALDIPEPFVISGGIIRVHKSLISSGMNVSAKVVCAGHSLGGVMLQDYLQDNPSFAVGQILLGSFLLEKYSNTTFKVPTLTIGGELDGLTRVTRIMEEYYRRILHSTDYSKALQNFPVVVVHGMTHMQFASGSPPPLVKLRDLKPEIPLQEAHSKVATYASAFISFQLGNASQLVTISSAVNATGLFLQPIIKAYELEGFYNFHPPCYDKTPSPACTKGSPWSEYAQVAMSGLPAASLYDQDSFHPVWQINPVHLPHVLNNCTSTKHCVLKTVTVTQNVYETGDSLDTGFVSTSANEIRVKLKSRQSILQAAGYPNPNFNETDGGSRCKIINNEAYNWGINNTGMTTLARYKQYGVQMVMGEDKGPYNEGPLWIWTPLSYKTVNNSQGRQVCEIRSVMMRTPTDYGIKAAAGMHYCKLLSPARVMEWIYVDSLRSYYHI